MVQEIMAKSNANLVGFPVGCQQPTVPPVFPQIATDTSANVQYSSWCLQSELAPLFLTPWLGGAHDVVRGSLLFHWALPPKVIVNLLFTMLFLCLKVSFSE